jgi:RNA polymerase sigma factor (sigma-70 family)
MDINTIRRDENDRLFQIRKDILDELEQLREKTKDATLDRSSSEYKKIKELERRLDDIVAEICEKNQGLVIQYAKRFSSLALQEDRDDYISAGQIGLLCAISTYELGRSTFASWAHKRILKEIQQTVRDRDHSTISIGDFGNRQAILEARRALIRQKNDPDYEPTPQEIADKAGAPLRQVLRILNPPKIQSLSSPVYGEEDSNVSMVDTIPDPTADTSGEVIRNLDIEYLSEFGLSKLDIRELFVLVRRYGLDREPPQNLTEIASLLLLTREAVRKIEARSLAKLQHPIVMHSILRGKKKEPTQTDA